MADLRKLTTLFVLVMALTAVVPVLAQDAALTPALLEGNWLTGCASRPEADGTLTYYTQDWLFLGDTWSLFYTTYADEACTTPLMDITFDGPYTLGALSAAAGATDADFTLARRTLVAYDAALLPALDANGCGLPPWEASIPQDISITGCAPLGLLRADQCPVEYDIIGVEAGGILRLGERGAGLCMAGTRPAALRAQFAVRNITTLEGRWASACEPVQTGDGGTLFWLRDFRFVGSYWFLTLVGYADVACSAPLYLLSIDGTFVLGLPNEAVPGSTNSDFGISGTYLTVFAPEFVPELDAAGCGVQAWEVEVTQNVSAGCDAMGVPGVFDCPVEYDVVALEGETLRFGDRTGNLCVPDTRPTALSAPLTRVQ